MRLDFFAVEHKLIKSRELAKEYIKNGYVTVNGEPVLKPSADICEDDIVSVNCEQLQYVGRGGLKLEKAIQCFNIDLSDKICMDFGASTGGFTDCMLQNNAKKVYAIDVGHDQLDKSLINNPSVVNMEKTNIKTLSTDSIYDTIDFISCDVSFISLKCILPKISEFLCDNKTSVILIKPQFEAGKKFIGKNGVVKDKSVQIRIINEILSYAEQYYLFCNGLTFSPISGGDGNIEYLLYVIKNVRCNKLISASIVVEEAYKSVKIKR